MAATSDGDGKKGNNLEANEVQLATDGRHFVVSTPSETGGSTYPRHPTPKAASGSTDPTVQGRKTSDPPTTDGACRPAAKKLDSAVALMEHPLRQERKHSQRTDQQRHILRIKHMHQECDKILHCSCLSAMRQTSGWAKCVHPDVEPDDVGFQHMLVYNLDSEPSLKKVLHDVEGRLKSMRLLGLILVPPSDSTVLLNAFWDSIVPSNICVSVVSQTDGRDFLDWLQDQNVGDVSVKVDLESSVDIPTVTVMERSSAQTAEADRSSFKWPWSKTGYSLFKQLKQYFDGTKINFDVLKSLVPHVMSHFQNFENSESRCELDKALNLLSARIKDDSFVQEYLLHMAIIYRMLSKRDVYKQQHKEYVHEFMKRAEEFLPNSCMLAVKIKRLHDEDNFKVAGIAHDTTSFFEVLCNASKILLRETRLFHKVGHFGLKMMWYEMELLFSERPVGKWDTFIAEEKYTGINISAEVNGIKSAILFGITLQLPMEMRLSGKGLVDMLVTKARTCHFVELGQILEDLQDSLFCNKDNLIQFIANAHSVCFTEGEQVKCLMNMSNSRELGKAMMEGVSFITTAVAFFGESTTVEEEPALCVPLCLWWKSMIRASMSQHPEVLCGAVNALMRLSKGYRQPSPRTKIKNCLCAEFFKEFEEEMNAMALKQFVVYLHYLPNIRKESVKAFLGTYLVGWNRSIPNLVCSEDFIELLDQFFSRWPQCESVYHKMFLDIMRKASKSYKPASSYIHDVLALKTEHLLCDDYIDAKETTDMMELHRDFKDHIRSFIESHKLKGSIVCRFFFDFMSKKQVYTPLQKVVLAVLVEFLCISRDQITKLSLRRPVNEISVLKHVLEKLTTHYEMPQTWDTPPAPPLTWYWEILNGTCLLVKPVAGLLDLSWCHEGQAAVPHLAKVYSAFSKTSGVTFLEGIPQTIQGCGNYYIRRYFEWVRKIQQFIHSWQQKIIEEDWTEADIMEYFSMIGPLRTIATSLRIEALEVSMKELEKMKGDMHNLKLLVENNLFHCDSNGRRCSLLGILHNYNVVIPQAVIEPLSLNVQNYQTCLFDTVNVGEEGRKAFHSFRMKDLKTLNETLCQFLSPIKQWIDFLVHFTMLKSLMFKEFLQERMCLQNSSVSVEPSTASSLFADLEGVMPDPTRDSTAVHSEDSTCSMQKFLQALKDTQDFLKSILLGQATFGSLCSLGCFQEGIGAIDVPSELRILQAFPFSGIGQCKDMGGIKSILQLIQFADYIDNIHCVCEQYHIDGCLSDMGMKRLLEIHSVLVSEEGKTELNAVQSEEYLAEIRDILNLNEEKWHALGIFAVVKDSVDFYKFLNEQKFRGTEGANSFMQQHTLITSHLQHEEYNEQILNHLVVAFRYMSPFLETEQSLSQLMEKVYRNCGQQAVKGRNTEFVQLRTVNTNIHRVRLWFSRAEGDTLENVAEDLRSLLNTGHFEFIIPESADESLSRVPVLPVWWKKCDQRRLLLHYQPSAAAQVGEAASDAPAKCVTWNREQIEDFTRKLGFLEKGSEDGMHFTFQRLSAIAQRVFGMQCELVNLGYPHEIEKTMKCSNVDEAERLIKALEEKLSDWKLKLKQLRNDCDMLLFFHIPKMLRMFKILHRGSSMPESIPQLVQEVSFLCGSTVETREHITASLQHLLARPQKDLQSSSTYAEDTQLPIAQLGKMLEALFQDGNILKSAFSKQLSPSLRTPCSVQAEASRLHTAHLKPHCVMHVAIDLKPKDVIRLIFDIYKGIPAPYEIYRCRADSTEEELSLIFQRMLRFSNLQFTFLEVNILPPKLQEILLQLHLSLEKEEHHCSMHYIAMKPSVLEDMPLVTVQEHKPASLKYTWKQTCTKCESLLNPNHSTFTAFELVYGRAGDGKTHYIRKKMRSSGGEQLTVAINESFSSLSVIQQLRSLPEHPHNVLYFSFTLLPPNEESSDVDQQLYKRIMAEVQWFLFDLFFLGYVEDPSSGLSFKMPSKLKWECYFEVPSYEEDEESEKLLQEFVEELPVLELVGKVKHIQPNHPFEVDSDVQLVCKYLNAYHHKDHPIHGINRLYELPPVWMDPNTPRFTQPTPVRFEALTDLPDELCHKLLTQYMPKVVKMNKTYQKLFIGYMKRRCKFLENFPGLNYNAGRVFYFKDEEMPAEVVDTSQLGSTIMETMLKEVSAFCSPAKRKNWSASIKQQLVYDIQDGGGCFHLIANIENMSKEDWEKYQRMGAELPPMHELATRKYLDKYLANTLNLSLEDGRLKAVDSQEYVLTLDYALKMLEIHERFECGIPVIIEGETGVGKTALVEMLSILWNHSLLADWRLLRDRILTLLKDMCNSLEDADDAKLSYQQLLGHIQKETPVKLEDLEKVCSLQSSAQVQDVLAGYVQQILTSPVVSLLDFEAVRKERPLVEEEGDSSKYPDQDFAAMVEHFRATHSSQTTAGLLFYLLRAQPIVAFHKLNVHAALTPKDFSDFFQPVFKLGVDLKNTWTTKGSTVPKVTVFLDEINTSSCMGLLKEVLVDRTFFGKPVPENIFIVAACNPHCGNSMILHEKNHLTNRSSESWVRASYNVHRLHPTIRYLKWDYGALDWQQEEQYIKVKMAMMEYRCSINLPHIAHLSIMIVQSQQLMRNLAADHLKTAFGYTMDMAKKLAHSCVSQRDIQRVFTLYDWLYRSYTKFGRKRFSAEDLEDSYKLQERAVMVALGIVYYLRLDEKSRTKYKDRLKKKMLGSMTVDEALKEELDFYKKHLSIPKGIAKTQALLENLFCIIACCCTKTPLIIVGAPGSSKTLSFNLALSNIQGTESKLPLFRDCELFPSMDPHFYQCSRRTTSVEVETVFLRAVKRQASFDELSMPISCVVFMDEAGLPEESHESLKVLHKYLDSRKVSFVAITNHLLDAAKTNRAASLFRTSYNFNDMTTLARECLGSTSAEDTDAKTVEKLCVPYRYWMNNHKWFKDFFGLRDFIHMIHYVRRGRTGNITAPLVMAALERNFNGCDAFNTVCKEFLRYLKASPETLRQRNVIEILQESLQDKPNHSLHGNQKVYDDVRYKLVIDPSEDDSLSRLLLMYKILDPKKTRTFMCSDFPEDSQLQKINTIAAIRHAAVEGQTVLMSQTDDIHESFYDLFNQHFRRIDDPDPNKEPRFYANIAIGSYHKPCRVHKDFQCVVIVRKSELPNTPAPFLNRFEKYCISHKDFLDARLRSLPPCLRVAMQCALEKVHEFLNFVGKSSFYGAQKGESVESLALSILPSPDFQFTKLTQESGTTTLPLADTMGERKEAENGAVVLLTCLISTLQEDAGFHFIKLSNAEVSDDAVHILGQLSSLTSNFKGIAQAIRDNYHSREELVSFVRDAVNHLHLHSTPETSKTEYGHMNQITKDSCIVVTVMVQWLVLYMSKRLLQLMTAEALTLSRKRIPHWCVDSYLTHQSHFSLKELINSNMQHASFCSTCVGTVPTKLVCFTRSTPNIHRLPSMYTTVHSITDDGPIHEALMKDMIADELSPLYLCKLSNILSEQAFVAQLQSFTQSKEKQIMLLVINMQETSKQMVNHVRIMVEQAESTARVTQKLFVLLLHFPPSMFYNSCYPALFLNGWDHHYLDSLQPEPEGIVDIRLWFSMACQQTHHPDSQDMILKAVQSMITNSISIVSSRVSIGAKKGGLFNSTPTDGRDKVRRFEQLLTGSVGDGLCRMYARYWQPAGIAHYLEEAALYSKDHKSTVSITDSVRDFFQTAFHNFLAYMVHIINEDLNIDIIFAQNCDKATLDLFIQLMQLLPKLPKLAEVKAYNNTWPAQQACTTTPSFPFFRRVAEAMDELLERSMEEMQSRKEPLAEDPIESELDSMSLLEDSYKKALFATLDRQLVASLDSGENPILKAAVTAIGEHDVFWQRYWKDFVANRFHLNAGEDKLTFEVLNLTIANPMARQDVRTKLVALHSTAYTNQINLAKLISSLRPLQMLVPAMPLMSRDPCTTFMSMLDQRPDHVDDPEALGQVIIDTLFSALAENCLKCSYKEMNYYEPEKLNVWRECYRDVTTQPSVVKILVHSSLREEPCIARLNVMAAVFLLLQVQAELSKDICDIAFHLGQKLVRQYFSDNLQMNKCPHLREIVGSFVDVLEDKPVRISGRDVTAYLENLFTFFFSPLSTELNENDVMWFLGYLNTSTSVDTSQLVTEVHHDVDLTPPVEREGPLPERDQSPLLNALSIGMAKRVLGEILTHLQKDEKPVPPLSIFCRKARSLVGQVLLEQDSVEGKVDHYIPLVYRQHLDIAAPPNPRMEQPLADVYFLVVLEHTMGEKTADLRLETVLNTFHNVRKALLRITLKPEESALLFIELQAVVQMMLWMTAQSLADSDLRSSALALSSEIKDLVQDSSTGGGKDSGHELVLMMHLLKQLNGPNALLSFLNSPITRDLPFLIPYKEKLTCTNEESVHLFPFMLQGAESPLADVYHRVTRLMVNAGADEQNAQARTALENELTEIARLKTLKGEKGNDIDSKLFLKMAVWLVVYYQFYNTGKKCPHLVNVIRSQCQILELTDEQVQLIQCFLDPDQMVQCLEPPPSTDVNEEIFVLGHDGQLQKKVKKVSPDQMADPIHALFNPPEGSRDDPSDVQLRHALANLIALAFSLPSRSTHLWYFLFGQSELEDTFLPGFMYPNKVAPNKMFYDCGVLLTEDGQFGRSDYRNHNSPLSLHSFYMIEWATFGVLCMALLTNPVAERKIHGHIISDWQPLRHFCLDQLSRIWLFMRSNLELSDEERSFLILLALYDLFERQSEVMPGKFETVEQVKQYELQWNLLYETSTSDLGEKLKKHSQLLNLEVFKQLSIIGTVYPQFPTERQFHHNLESLLGSSKPSNPQLSILAHFMDDRERLAVGSALLPDLVEMYLWLDMHLSHLLPYEAACKMTLKEIIAKASKRFPSQADHLHELCRSLIKNFNTYVRLNGGFLGTGGCVRHHHDKHVTEITDSMPVIRLLSTESNSSEGGMNDWLCLVMKDIISAHNNLVQMVTGHGKDASFACWLQSVPVTVEAREFSLAEALYSNEPHVRSDKRLLSMIRSRYLPMVPDDTSMSVAVANPMRTSPMFDLSKLGSDVVYSFIAGKPFLEDVNRTLWRSFRFRDNKADPWSAKGLAGPGCPVNLAALSQELPQSCKAELTEDNRKMLEAEFHSARYNVLSELVTGLRTAAGHLYQTLQKEGLSVLEQTLIQFLSRYFGVEEPGTDLLQQIVLEGFTAEQLHALEMLPVKHLYKTLEMFVGWINDCFYDFHELPFAVKRPLPPSVPKWFEEKIAETSAFVSLEKLKDLEDTVSHIAQGLHKGSIKPLQPLRENLVTDGFYGDKDTALQLVPGEVLLQHYMHFVVLLRKWRLQLQSACNASTAPQVWVEVVHDLWEKLPFQDSISRISFSAKDFVLDPHTMKLAFETTEEDFSSSKPQDSEEIWLDCKDSIESEPDMSENATRWDSGTGDVTDLSATFVQNETEGDQEEVDQQRLFPSPIPSKHDSQASVDNISTSQVSIASSIPASVLAREPSEKAMAMTPEEVIQWLHNINLSKYTDMFKDKEVDGELLATFGTKDLQEMGIESGIDQKKIFVRFRRIN